MGDEGRGQGGRLRPFDRRLLGRVRVARRTLAICVTAGLAAALLLLAQMTLLAGVIAGAAEGRLDQVPFGLRSMRGRVADLGGRLEITSTPGRGTALRVEVPAQR